MGQKCLCGICRGSGHVLKCLDPAIHIMSSHIIIPILDETALVLAIRPQ